jgi:hypothetical protein
MLLTDDDHKSDEMAELRRDDIHRREVNAIRGLHPNDPERHDFVDARDEPTISAGVVLDGARFGVELFITGLKSEAHAQRALDMLLQYVAGAEIKVN